MNSIKVKGCPHEKKLVTFASKWMNKVCACMNKNWKCTNLQLEMNVHACIYAYYTHMYIIVFTDYTTTSITSNLETSQWFCVILQFIFAFGKRVFSLEFSIGLISVLLSTFEGMPRWCVCMYVMIWKTVSHSSPVFREWKFNKS